MNEDKQNISPQNFSVSNTDNKLEETVMAEIKSGRIKLRSRYVFLAEKLGVGSAITLTILLAILFFNLFLFYLKSSDNLHYLSFGSFGLFAFLESFPFGLVTIFILLIFISGLIVKKSGILYQKSFGYLAIFLILGIMLLGVVLTFTSLAEVIERASYNDHPGAMFFRPFFRPGFENRRNGVSGRVVKIGTDYLIIQNPDFEERLDMSAIKDMPDDLDLGTFITAIGERNGKIFRVSKIRMSDPDDMPMIRRGIDHQFGELPNLPEHFNPHFNLHTCLVGCRETNLPVEDCDNYCSSN